MATACGTLVSQGLSEVIERDLRQPVSCLRAAIESRLKRGSFAEQDADFMQAVLEKLDDLCATSELLGLATQPPAIQPLSCSLDEIAHATLQFLPENKRNLVFTRATPSGRATLDGPLLSHALAQLLESCMGSLSKSRLELIVSNTSLGIDIEVERPTSEQRVLMLGCAWRELHRMNASTSMSRTSESISFHAEIPVQGISQREIAA